MNADVVYELVGYAGSALVIGSIIQRSIFKLRVIGLIGSITFLVYGILIDAPPIVIVNVLGGSIHAYYLTRLIRSPAEIFNVLRVRPDSRLMAHFLEFHQSDIEKGMQPDFIYEESDDQITSFILRDLVPAGLFVGRRHVDRTVEILLDYVSPEYRDFKIGAYLYSKAAGLFYDPTLTTLWADTTDTDYVAYLRRMNFHHDPHADHPDRYALDLPPIINPR